MSDIVIVYSDEIDLKNVPVEEVTLPEPLKSECKVVNHNTINFDMNGTE